MSASVASEERIHLLARVATLYYDDRATQAEIAQKLCYSRSAISRLLTEAHERGIVEIRIHYPLRREPDLEAAIRSKFGLRRAIVLARGNLPYSRMLRQLGRLAARYLAEQLDSIQLLALSWGTALYEVVNALPARRTEGLSVVQMIGSAGDSDPKIDGPELARTLAENLSAPYQILPAPLMVEDTNTRDALYREPRIRETLQTAERADLAIVGIGSLRPELSSFKRAGYLDDAALDTIAREGAVGDICAWHFDIHGNILDIDMNRRRIGANLAAIREGSTTVVGVAGGGRKAVAILGALRGGFLDVLVTDSTAGERVLAYKNSGITRDWLFQKTG